MNCVRNIHPFGLRMPPSLKQVVITKARENRRSLNSEIVKRLEESVKAEQSENLRKTEEAPK